MANQEWENERLFVLETVKSTQNDLKTLSESFTDFKTTVSTQLAVLATKLAMYAVLTSAVGSIVMNLIIENVK